MSEISENSTAYKLRKCRINCGLSQNVVAAALGVDRTTYTYYESGRTQPSITTIVRLADIFCVEPSTLLPTEATSKTLKDWDTNSPNPIYTLRKDEQRLLVFYRTLSDREKEKALAIITKMLKHDT